MRTWLEIDKQALLHNLRQFLNLIGPQVHPHTKDSSSLSPDSRRDNFGVGVKFMAVVKANAYGHGVREIAQIIQHSTFNILPVGRQVQHSIWFGVDSIDEALVLRQEGITAPILTLGYVPLDRLEDAVTNNIRLTVYNKETIEKLALALSPLPAGEGGGEGAIRIHLKVETGTSRQGISENEILDFVKFTKQYPQIEIEGLSTHFANIEDTTDHSYAQSQLDAFKRVVALLEANGINIPVKHTACSAATILFPETHFDMVRAGISLYGLWSSKETFVSASQSSPPSVGGVRGGGHIDLVPVLSWKSMIAQIKKIPAGTPVGYGLTERVSHDSKIAIVPVGYYDGYDRKLSSVGNVLIRGKRCKVLGRVCMNMMVVDITDVPDARLEDEVVLLGAQDQERITAEELAQKIGTINYEVVTRINPLLPRVIK